MDPKEQIKENLSILDVISSYIKVEKSGSQYKARCPFHNERTPSFYISPERKSYHCFGCGAHGDIFTFVEKTESIPFVEALRMLAERAGVSLKDHKKNEKEGKLIDLLEDATIFFESEIKKSPEANFYLSERGLTEETKKIFRIGLAPNEWRKLFIFLSMKGYTPEEMEESGLVIKALDAHGKVKGWYDRFRGRVMFPIRNIGGKTVGFSGRILPQYVDPSQAQGKYVNTPETNLYHKSKILFGYDTAKKKMAETKEVVVVEGQMDLCMSYQAGVHNTIAVSGTAFTDEHIKLIKRFAESVILSFDSDEAGVQALKKSAKLCLFGGLDVYAVTLEAKDPADLIKEDVSKWPELLHEKVHVIFFLLKRLKDTSHDERELRKKVKEEILPLVGAIQSPLDRDFFLTKISEETSIDKKVLESETFLEQEEEKKHEVVFKKEIKRKEELLITLAAFVSWKKLGDHELIYPVRPEISGIPEDVIEAEIFRLQREVADDISPETMLRDIVLEYKKEHISETIETVRNEMKLNPENEVLLQKLHILTKEKEALYKKNVGE